MRRGNEPSILRDDAGRVLAVNLSADYCAEHEWGIKGIRQDYGLPEALDVYGVKRRQIAQLPTRFRTLAWVKDGNREGFAHTYHQHWQIARDSEMAASRYSERTLAAAWSETGFAIVGVGAEIVALREVFDAFQALNICILLSGGGVFENAGLVLAIADRLPADVPQRWWDADKDLHEVKQYEERTGLSAYLKGKGMRWFYLGAKRWGDGGIRWWLNPEQQDRYAAGYYTEQELRQWADGNGPVIENRKANRAEVTKRERPRARR